MIPGNSPSLPHNSSQSTHLPQSRHHSQLERPPVDQSNVRYTENNSAAASFFTRAGQKMPANSSSKKKKRSSTSYPEVEGLQLFTRFCDTLRATPPSVPPSLLKSKPNGSSHSTPKIKVLMVVRHPETGKGTDSSSCVSVDSCKRQLTLFEPSSLTGFVAPSQRKSGTAPPKLFALDAIYSGDDPLTELCSNALTDIVQTVVEGTDGCLFCFGHSKLGKSYTMMGSDSSPMNFGIIPCAISWLFNYIEDQKERTGARFSVRVSAVELHGKDEKLTDLLAKVSENTESSAQPAPGVYLKDDPISGTQLENQSELRAPSAEKAALFLDAALASRRKCESDSIARMSHMLFTLHVYQYRVEKSGVGSGVTGGRSRLHLIDLSSGRSSSSNSQESSAANSSCPTTALSLPGIASVLQALVTGQRHVPNRDSKLSQLLREAMGSLNCKVCMIPHISSNIQHYNESLQVVQLAAKFQRLRRRRTRTGYGSISGASSDDSSSCDSFGMRRSGRLRPQMGLLRTSALTSASEADYTSSSEQSCDTAIYLGRGEMTDNEGPPPEFGQIRASTLQRRNTTSAVDSDCSDSSHKSAPSSLRSRTSAKKATPRTNALAWPRAAVKMAIETLSTQKEQWVDGPRAVYNNEQVTTNQTGPEQSVNAQPASASALVTTLPPPLYPAMPPSATSRSAGSSWNYPNESPPSAVYQPPLVRSNAPIVKNKPETAPMRQVELVDKETQSEEPYESESSTSASTYSTMDRKNKRVLSDISERTEEIDTPNDSEKEQKENEEDEDMVNDALEGIEVPSILPSSSNTANTSLCGTMGSMYPGPTANFDTNSLSNPLTTVFESHTSSQTNSNQYTTSKLISEHCYTTNNECKTPKAFLPESNVKPFVRDWIEKHLQSDAIPDEDEIPEELTPKPMPPVSASVQSSPMHFPDAQHFTSETVVGSPARSTPKHQYNDSSQRRSHRTRKSRDYSQPSLPTVPVNPNQSIARVAEWVQSVNIEPLPDSEVLIGNRDVATGPKTADFSRHHASRRSYNFPIDHSQTRPEFGGSLDRKNSAGGHLGGEALTTMSLSMHNSSVGNQDKRGKSVPPNSIGSENDESETQRLWYTSTHSKLSTSSNEGTISAAHRPDGKSNSLVQREECMKLAEQQKVPLPTNSQRGHPSLKLNNIGRSPPFDTESNRYPDFITSSPQMQRISSFRGVPPPSAIPSSVRSHRSASSSPVSSRRHTVEDNNKFVQDAVKSSFIPVSKSNKPEKVPSKEKPKEKSKLKEGSSILSSLFGRRKDKESKKQSPSPKSDSPKSLPLKVNMRSSTSPSLSSPSAQTLHSVGVSTLKTNKHVPQPAVHPSILVSPYSTVTPPRMCTHSSSGQASSDCSGGFTNHNKADGITRCRPGCGHASSGYESMIRDSISSSSHNDSNSESSLGGLPAQSAANTSGHKSHRYITAALKKARSKTRSNSFSTSPHSGSVAPPEPQENETTTKSSLLTNLDRELTDEAKSAINESILKQITLEKINELLAEQEKLKSELFETRKLLNVDPSTWSFDLYVAEQMDPNDPNYIVALKKETEILRRRVDACKSRVLMVTTFDAKPLRKGPSDVMTSSVTSCPNDVTSSAFTETTIIM